MNFQKIKSHDAHRLMNEKPVQLVDIRDELSFVHAHIPDAQHLSNASLQAFLEQADKERPLIVYCYHGHSSQPVAQFFAQQAFQEVYSLEGGFESWEKEFPDDCVSLG